jgi:molybdopterin molybdotransferase
MCSNVNATKQAATSGNKPISFDEAAAIVSGLRVPPRAETLPLEQAKHRILAADAIARIDMPPFYRAMMDGYAIRAADIVDATSRLAVIGRTAAGDGMPSAIKPGEAVRIATGARIPEGADSVARFEWSREMEDGTIRVIHPMKVGESVQSTGSDGKAGEALIRAGARLTSARMMVCKSFGIAQVTVTVPTSVAIVMTGKELVPSVNQPLQPGQIYASTDAYLVDAVEQDGARVVSVQQVTDDREAIRQAILQAAASADYVLMTGGVSAGDFDFVPGILKEIGPRPVVERVLMRPGAPFVATRLNRTNVFAMSGNPAAGLIQFEMFVRPVIRKSLGMADQPFTASGKLAFGIELKPMKHVRILRAHAYVQAGEIWVDARMAQAPGVVSGFSDSNCLIRADHDQYAVGAVVPLRWLGYPELAGG